MRMQNDRRPNRPRPHINEPRVNPKYLRVSQLKQSHYQSISLPQRLLLFPLLYHMVQMSDRKKYRHQQNSLRLRKRARFQTKIYQTNSIDKLFVQRRNK